jgi:AcrR family transcriptional regulator
MLRPVIPVEGGAPFPASWPSTARSKLLAAMAAGVAANGFARTSVDDVLDLARASRRTFYVHFENREHCLGATHEAIRRDVLSTLENDRLETCLDGLLRYFAAWPTHAHVITTEIVALGPAGIERHERLLADVAARLRRCTDPSYAAAGRLAAEDLEQMRVAALFRMVQQRVNTRKPASLVELAADLARLMHGAAIR